VEQWEEEERMETTVLKKQQKKNSIQNSVGNEENGYSVADPNKTMKNVTKEPRNNHKKSPQRRTLRRNH
jgi:hypothetical protein